MCLQKPMLIQQKTGNNCQHLPTFWKQFGRYWQIWLKAARLSLHTPSCATVSAASVPLFLSFRFLSRRLAAELPFECLGGGVVTVSLHSFLVRAFLQAICWSAGRELRKNTADTRQPETSRFLTAACTSCSYRDTPRTSPDTTPTQTSYRLCWFPAFQNQSKSWTVRSRVYWRGYAKITYTLDNASRELQTESMFEKKLATAWKCIHSLSICPSFFAFFLSLARGTHLSISAMSSLENAPEKIFCVEK